MCWNVGRHIHETLTLASRSFAVKRTLDCLVKMDGPAVTPQSITVSRRNKALSNFLHAKDPRLLLDKINCERIKTPSSGFSSLTIQMSLSADKDDRQGRPTPETSENTHSSFCAPPKEATGGCM